MPKFTGRIPISVRLLHHLLLVASLSLLGWLVVRADWQAIPRGAPLLGCAACYLVAATARPAIWVQLLHAMNSPAPGPDLRLEVWRSTSRARATRYIPGRVVNWAARYVIATRSGYGGDATAESIAVDSLLPPCVLICIAGAALGAAAAGIWLGLLLPLLEIGALGWMLGPGRRHLRGRLLAMIPKSDRRIWARLRLALAGRTDLEVRRVLFLLVLYFVWGTARIAGFVMFTFGVAELGAGDIGFTTLAGAAGGIAGQLSFIAPMGLGVREGTTASILSDRLPLAAAALAVTGTRLVQLGAELGAILLTEAVYLGRRTMVPRSHPPTEA